MVRPIHWHPDGCGVAALGLSGVESSSAGVFPVDLTPRCEQLDMGIEDLFYAWELSRLAGDEVSLERRRALMILVLAVRLMAGEGSTRLPLVPGSRFDQVMSDLQVTDGERFAIDQLLLEAGQAALGDVSAGLSDIFGGPDDYRPLLVDHDCLYMQKLHVLEARVGEALRERIAGGADPAVAESVDVAAGDIAKAEDVAGDIAKAEAVADDIAKADAAAGDMAKTGAAAGNIAGTASGVTAAGPADPTQSASGISAAAADDDTRADYWSGGTGFRNELEAALKQVFDYPPVFPYGKAELDQWQKKAVRAALSGRIAVISGRPGSGKTSIVAGILRVLARMGRPTLGSIALAAPTGKAADRMRQSINAHLLAIPAPGEADRRLMEACPPASTLHRLLGYSPGRDIFRHGELNPLAEKLVIVDESSMIDLAMMDRLLRALQPAARLVLLGDADQLPSIEAGAVLRDLCRAQSAVERERVVVLERSYRAREEDVSGKQILDTAAAFNEGKLFSEAASAAAPVVSREAEKLRFQGVEYLTPGDEDQKEAFLTRWYQLLLGSDAGLEESLARDYLAGASGFDQETTVQLQSILAHYERFRILCATRVSAGGTGTGDVNAWFHRRWLSYCRRLGRVPVSSHFLVGEPVLMTRNDYSLRLYNGDSGLVLKVAPDSGMRRRPAEPMAVFPRSGSYAAFPLDLLRGRLEPAWATTVHKAQGSEYDHIGIILPAVKTPNLTRELLYTAVTRAKNSVTIVGSAEILRAGIANKMERASGLAEILSQKSLDSGCAQC